MRSGPLKRLSPSYEPDLRRATYGPTRHAGHDDDRIFGGEGDDVLYAGYANTGAGTDYLDGGPGGTSATTETRSPTAKAAIRSLDVGPGGCLVASLLGQAT